MASDTSTKAPKLTYADAFALLVSLQIGSGIFASPSQVDKHARAPGFAVLLWLISGLLAWAGATSYAELGVTLPVNGGMQEYLRYIYGDGLAFMAAWIWIVAVKPCGQAVLSITFAQYWVNVVLGATAAANGWQSKLISILSFWAVVCINTISMDTSTKLMRLFLVIKIATIALLFIFTSLSLFFHVHIGEGPSNTDWYKQNWFGTTNSQWQPGFLNTAGQSTIAIYAGLWAFSGWDNANIVAGDMRDASKDLPRALHSAQPLVITCFILASLCYYVVVPWADIDATNTIAVTVGDTVLGWTGSLVFAILVSLACLGSVNVNVFTSARLIVSAAQANWLPRSLEKYSSVISSRAAKTSPDSPAFFSTSPTPIRAMLLNAVLTTIYMFFGTFGSLITFIGLAEYLFYCATVFGLILLRYKEPLLPRLYRANILIPILFTGVSLFLVVFGSVQAPVQAALIALLVAMGFARKYVALDDLWSRVTELTAGGSRGRYQSLRRPSV